MRFEPEISDDANAGLSIMRDMLLPVVKNHPELSIADIWTFAGKCSIEFAGGPSIPHNFGRTDAADGSACPANGLLPDASQGAQHLRDVFYRMGFDDRGIVALSGAHTLGRCHLVRSGFDGPWTSDPLKFDNAYFTTLLENEWVKRDWDGNEQFEDVATGKLMMLPTDMAIKTDPAFRKVAEEYAADEKLFFKEFAEYFGRLLGNGCPHASSDKKPQNFEASAQFRENAMHGSVAAMGKALAAGADPNSVEGKSGRNALHKAAFWGHIQATNFLLKECKATGFNAQDYNGDTPLHDAARFGHLDVVEALVRGGADPSTKNAKGNDVFDVADDYNKPEVVALLKSLGGAKSAGSAGDGPLSIGYILNEAKKAGKTVDPASIAFTLSIVAGKKSAETADGPATDGAPALPAAAISSKL